MRHRSKDPRNKTYSPFGGKETQNWPTASGFEIMGAKYALIHLDQPSLNKSYSSSITHAGGKLYVCGG